MKTANYKQYWSHVLGGKPASQIVAEFQLEGYTAEDAAEWLSRCETHVVRADERPASWGKYQVRAAKELAAAAK